MLTWEEFMAEAERGNVEYVTPKGSYTLGNPLDELRYMFLETHVSFTAEMHIRL
jgi:hypothetical protein